jgi:hypothetical protein
MLVFSKPERIFRGGVHIQRRTRQFPRPTPPHAAVREWFCVMRRPAFA